VVDLAHQDGSQEEATSEDPPMVTRSPGKRVEEAKQLAEVCNEAGQTLQPNMLGEEGPVDTQEQGLNTTTDEDPKESRKASNAMDVDITTATMMAVDMGNTVAMDMEAMAEVQGVAGRQANPLPV